MSGTGWVQGAVALWHREWVRFLRQRSRVGSAIGTPLLFWLLLGFGMRASFMPGAGAGSDYMTYFFPGTLLLILLFTCIFSTISLIEDRREGFLQCVLVSPAPRASLVLGKIAGGATLAIAQGLLYLLLAPLAGYHPDAAGIAAAVAAMVALSIGLSAMGFFFAWHMESIQGFHAVMNLVLMPMWFLSGALFPVEGAPLLFRAVMYANPLTWGLRTMRMALDGSSAGSGEFLTSLLVTAGFSLVMFVVACLAARRTRRHDLV